MKQESGTHEGILDFTRGLGITFPVYGKVRTNGAKTDGLFDFIKKQVPGIFGTTSVKWNFTKFLCGRDGIPRKRFSPSTCPSKLAADIEQLLEEDVDAAAGGGQ